LRSRIALANRADESRGAQFFDRDADLRSQLFRFGSHGDKRAMRSPGDGEHFSG